MPNINLNYVEKIRHTKDMQAIIVTKPSWLIRWGITILIFIFIFIIGLFMSIQYPYITHNKIKIFINRTNDQFSGEIAMSQNSISVEVGQKVLIKVKNFSINKCELIGKLISIVNSTSKGNNFICKINFLGENQFNLKRIIHSNDTLTINAEIIQNTTLWHRIKNSKFAIN